MTVKWRFGFLAACVLLVCGLYPQLQMWNLRGGDWQGHYAYNDIDEVAYSAYLAALIDGRPRRNDPYSGRDDRPEQPQEESLFSIQFAAPYAVAIPARVFGISAPTAMWLAGGIAAFLTALACFWLIALITKDSLFALAATLVVLCGGALAAGEGAIGEILGSGVSYPYFPFLRRYVPAVPFPAFFALCAFVWLMVTSAELKKRILFCALASFCFAFTVFSYFYIWTTAAAWLACVGLVWLVARPEGWRKDLKAFAALAAACAFSLIPYAVLLSNRSHTMDDIQLLVMTRAPDLLRAPEIISYVVLLMLAAAIRLKIINFKERATLFAFAFALVPIVVFNQQIITGRSLQPIHYQVFIGNYVAATALVLAVGLLWRNVSEKLPEFSRSALTVVAVVAAVWGIIECFYTVRVLDDANIARDDVMKLGRRLREDGSSIVLSPDGTPAAVFTTSMIYGDDLPTLATQPVLWARHQHVFPGLTWAESKERYYQWLYYMDLDERWLQSSMMQGDFISMIALFGWGRHTSRLNSEYKPLTRGEIAQEAKRFGDYRKNFTLAHARQPTLSFVIVPKDNSRSFSNLKRWYEFGEGEDFGDYTLYRVKLKESNQ